MEISTQTMYTYSRTVFWEKVHVTLQDILRYKIPNSCVVLYLCNLTEDNVQARDRYLVKILLVSAKKAVTRKWGKEEPPTWDQWLEIIEEIYTMEKLTHRLRLQEAQLKNKWLKWTNFRLSNSDNRSLM